ncbi:MAG TPA: efflux RND transporter periplasmic adaptor subunit [Pyrinomonadaceae bacterium]|nr:efflux RND transporter periplasmic adaptor subunit [Pyrinomonadaceae bacterium]
MKDLLRTSRRVLLACCLLPAAFCLPAFGQGGTGKLPRRNPPPIRNPVDLPTITYYKSTVVASGEVRPERYVRIAGDATGQVKEIYVQPGDEITKGQRLLLIEPGTTGSASVTQYSPVKGVVADIVARVGEPVVVGPSASELMTLAEMSKIFVDVIVEANQISKIATRNAAKIRVDAFPENEIRGVVISKNPVPITVPGNTSASRPKELRVRIELSDIPAAIRSRLRPGMSATATITVLLRATNR